MKKTVTEQLGIRQELYNVQTEIAALMTRYRFTDDSDLLDALNYQLLALQARRSFLLRLAKQQQMSS